MNKLFLFILIFLGISCQEKFDQDVAVKGNTAKCKNINDTTKFCYTRHENGKIKSLFRMKNDGTEFGKLVQFNATGDAFTIFSLSDGKFHGKAYHYERTTLVLLIYIENYYAKFRAERIPKARYKFLKKNKETVYTETIDTTIVENDSIRITSYRAHPSPESNIGAGHLIYVNNQVSEFSDYIQLKVPDTLCMGEEFRAELNHHIRNSNKAWVIFGEYDKNLEIVEPKHPDTITIYDGKPYYHKLKATKPGVNKITGIVIGITDSTRRNPKPFYDMYYVKE